MVKFRKLILTYYPMFIMKKLQAGLLAVLFSLGLVGGISAPAVVADGGEIVKTCTQWHIDNNLCNSGLRQMVLKIINWVLFFLGLITTGFIIYGGFLYVTSAGNNENIEKAKKLIIYAIIGLIVIILAAVLVDAILDIPGGGVDSPAGGGA